MAYKKKLIEVALPLEAINKESAREKSIRHSHPSTLHLWWARRPLAACRAVLFASRGEWCQVKNFLWMDTRKVIRTQYKIKGTGKGQITYLTLFHLLPMINSLAGQFEEKILYVQMEEKDE